MTWRLRLTSAAAIAGMAICISGMASPSWAVAIKGQPFTCQLKILATVGTNVSNPPPANAMVDCEVDVLCGGIKTCNPWYQTPGVTWDLYSTCLAQLNDCADELSGKDCTTAIVQ